MKDKRVKNATFILYPDTGFEIAAIEEYIRKAGYKAAISPLHTPDEDEKKPHYHCIIALSSPRQLSSLSQEFAAVAQQHCTACMNVGDMGALNRYLTHEDNPEKQQFNVKPRIYNGYEYDKYVFRKYSDCDVSIVLQKIGKYVFDEHVRSFGELIALVYADADFQLADYCINHAYAINLIVKESRKRKEKNHEN